MDDLIEQFNLSLKLRDALNFGGDFLSLSKEISYLRAIQDHSKCGAPCKKC